MSKPRFAIRTIRNGRVKIFHRWFEPQEKWEEYDGRLEGLRYAFGLYYNPHYPYVNPTESMEPYVYLWGSEEQYHDPELLDFRGPEITKDGGLPWIFWNEVEDD